MASPFFYRESRSKFRRRLTGTPEESPKEVIPEMDSDESIDEEFDNIRRKMNDPERIRKEFTAMPKRKPVDGARERTIKSKRVKKQLYSQTDLTLRGNSLVPESISLVRPPVYHQYVEIPIATPKVPLEWKSSHGKIRSPPRPNPVLDALNPSRNSKVISRQEIAKTKRELSRIEEERLRALDSQTPAWAKGGKSMTNSSAVSRRQVRVISKTQQANDIYV